MTAAMPEPKVSDKYEPGAILEHSWGYEQTNIDYWMVTRRKGEWVWLVPMTKKSTPSETLFMQGTCIPIEPKDVKPIRRKLCIRDGMERGLGIESYGWCSLWDGKPSQWTNYA